LFLCNLNNLKPQLSKCDRKLSFFFTYWMNISSSFFFKTLVLCLFLVWIIPNIWNDMHTSHLGYTLNFLFSFHTSNTHDNCPNSHFFHVLEPLPYKSSSKIIITCNFICHMVPSLWNDYWDCSNLVYLVNLTLIRWVWSNFCCHLFLMFIVCTKNWLKCLHTKLMSLTSCVINRMPIQHVRPNCYRSKGLWIILINDWRQFLLLFTLKFFLISTFWWFFIVLSVSMSLCFNFMFKNNLNILSN